MKIFRKANTVGALMIAAGAVVTGASVTSGAMAADDAGRSDSGSAVIVGAAGPAGSGEAYQCVFEGVELPDLGALEGGETSGASQTAQAPLSAQGPAVAAGGSEPIGASGVAGAGGNEEIEGADVGATPVGEATSFQVTVGDDGNVRGPVSGPIGEGMPIEVGDLGVDGSGNVVMSAGAIPAGEAAEGEAIPVEAIEMSDVREGTEEECAALMDDLASSATQLVDAVTGTEAVTETAP